MGGKPIANSAGNVTNDAPPAIELAKPPKKPAINKIATP
jgi:hypothetical protein